MKKRWILLSVAAFLLSLVGVVLFFQRVNFYIISVAVLIVSMLPFFISFEIKNISAVEISLTATMIALAVVSRAAFYLIPQVKPIAAVVVIAAVSLGAERGYIIGAFSAFISNFIFGQGLWTPFQMVALGLIGFVSGLVFRLIKPDRWSLSAVGFLLAFILYGAIVDLPTIIMTYGSHLTVSGIVSVYAAALPFNAAFAVSTAVFLFVFGKPFINKLQRINAKYGICNHR